MTSTYAILEVSRKSFLDILRRLNKLGVLDNYLDEDSDGKAIIVLGTVAIKVEVK